MPCRAMIVWMVSLLLAGCTFTSFLAPKVDPDERQVIVAASVEKVGALLQEVFTTNGIAVLEKRKDRELHLVGSASSRQMFCLVLKRAKGDRTVVSVLHGTEIDEHVWEMVLQALAAFPAAPSKSALPADQSPDPDAGSRSSD